MTEISYGSRSSGLLTTALPGPRSQELAARRKATVAAGVGSTSPVYAADADGGVIVDVDGNRSSTWPRYRGHQCRRRASESGCGGAGADRAVRAHLLHGDPVRGVHPGVCEELAALTRC